MPGDLGNPSGHQQQPDDLQRLATFLSESSARGASALASEAGFVKNNVELDRYDARLFAELVQTSEALRDLAGANDAPHTFGPLILDLFSYFYKFVPSLVDETEVDPAHLRANRPFIERMREDEQTQVARLSTATDEVASSLATIEAAKKILEELRRRPELADWMEQASQDEASPEQPGPEHALPEGRSPEKPSTTEAVDREQTYPDEPEDADDSASGGSEEPQPSPSPPGGSPSESFTGAYYADPPPASHLRAAMRSATNAASSEAAGHASALRNWGLEPADLRVAESLAERIDLARKLRTKRMRDLADLLGKMRNHRRATERRKVKANRGEVHSIETSGDISRALPSEMAAAFGSANPNRRLDFYRRLSERSVLSCSLRSEESVGRGPIIAMIDASYSMSGAPMEWASAVALALAQAASGGAASARRVEAIFFNAKIVLELEIAPGEKDVRKFLSIANVEAAGGTEYVPPISRALEVLAGGPPLGSAARGSGEASPDLLLVTDGLCELPEEYVGRLAAEKEARGFKLVSVLVGEHARAGSLEPFSERLVRAADLARASGARDAAGEVFENL